MEILNANIIGVVSRVIADLKARHIPGHLFVEASTSAVKTVEPIGSVFTFYDLERSFAVVLQECYVPNTNKALAAEQREISFVPLCTQPANGSWQSFVRGSLKFQAHEIGLISMLTAFWFMRTKSAITMDDVLYFLSSTYADLSQEQWGRAYSAINEMVRFLQDAKVPLAA